MGVGKASRTGWGNPFQLPRGSALALAQLILTPETCLKFKERERVEEDF